MGFTRNHARVSDITVAMNGTQELKVAVAQFTVCREPERNFDIIDGYARQAACAGARLLVLPEGLIARDGDDDMFAAAHAQPLDGPFVTGLRRISEARHITLMGTVHAVLGAADAVPDKPASCATDSRVSNVFVVIRDGALIATYRKLHLYDAFAARESDTVRPGIELPPIVEIDGWHVGVMTCYDVRFPEVARSLAVRGADVIIVSAAWVRGRLKERHWKLMTAARALGNTCYVLACSEVSARNIGCSRVIDPLGEVIAQADDGQGGAGGQAGMLIARLHREVLESARRTLPVLENRRFADPQLRD